MTAIEYKATKTASIFHHDNNFVRLLMGPVGCGKSVANCVELFRRACEQEAGNDNVRRVRIGVVRNTYPELKSTTIKTWLDWFPEEEFGKIKWDSPITHTVHMPGIVIEAVFLALNGEIDIGKLMSFEFTMIYINELQYIHPKIFKKCQERVGRYPAKKTGADITWTGVIADTNPPSTRHWIYKLFEKEKPANFEIYKFPPALLVVNEPPEGVNYAKSRDGTFYIANPEADYIQNQQLGEMYYLNQVPGKEDQEIKVSIQGEYGVLISGRPVHPEYKDKLHYADKPLHANTQIEIGLGWDFGLTPACVIVQMMPNGQLCVLMELWSERDGLKQFIENTVIPYLNMYYPWWKTNYVSRHDPAGQQAAQTDQKSCQQILLDLGINSFPAAPSNAPTPRREGLKYHLTRLVGGEPGLLLSNQCPVLREGLMGHFQYGRIQAGTGVETRVETRYHEKPLKNMHSHSCEALEYIAMHYSQPKTDKEGNKKAVQTVVNSFMRLQKLREQAYGQTR